MKKRKIKIKALGGEGFGVISHSTTYDNQSAYFV